MRRVIAGLCVVMSLAVIGATRWKWRWRVERGTQLLQARQCKEAVFSFWCPRQWASKAPNVSFVITMTNRSMAAIL